MIFFYICINMSFVLSRCAVGYPNGCGRRHLTNRNQSEVKELLKDICEADEDKSRMISEFIDKITPNELAQNPEDIERRLRAFKNMASIKSDRDRLEDDNNKIHDERIDRLI